MCAGAICVADTSLGLDLLPLKLGLVHQFHLSDWSGRRGSFSRDAALRRGSTCAVQRSNSYKYSSLPHLERNFISYCLQKPSGLHCLGINNSSVIGVPGELVVDQVPFVLKPFKPRSGRLL